MTTGQSESCEEHLRGGQRCVVTGPHAVSPKIREDRSAGHAHMISRPAREWAWVMLVGVAVVMLVIVPFHVRVGGIKVKYGAPAIALSVPEVPEQCRPPAELRVAAAVAVLSLSLVIAALARRHAESHRHRESGSERPTPVHGGKAHGQTK